MQRLGNLSRRARYKQELQFQQELSRYLEVARTDLEYYNM